MATTLARWGNSLAVRVPRHVADEAQLSEGASVSVKAEHGRLIIESARPRYVLAELLSQMTPEHRNVEVDWGGPVGNETW